MKQKDLVEYIGDNLRLANVSPLKGGAQVGGTVDENAPFRGLGGLGTQAGGTIDENAPFRGLGGLG